MTIVCMYTCKACGINRAKIEVPARKDEDVKVWLENTVVLIKSAHDVRSPNCHPKQLDELLIPHLDPKGKVGGSTVQ